MWNRLKTTALPCLIATLFAAGANSQEVRRYQPQTPTISPYLNLLRFNDSGLPNYYSLVRPQQSQRATNRRQDALRRQQLGQFQQFQRDLEGTQQLVAPTGNASWFQNPGQRSRFQNLDRYYPAVNVRR